MTGGDAKRHNGDPTRQTGNPKRQAVSGLERRLVVLMAARLALSLVSLGIAVGLEAAGWNFTTAEWRGFYATIAFAFFATIAYGLMLRRVRRPKRFAAINCLTDIAIATALVHFSGGAESAFTFLYVLVAIYSAVLLDRPAALAAAGLMAGVYGSLLTAEHLGWVATNRIGPPEPAPVLFTRWAITSGAVLVAGFLASRMAVEMRRTGEALVERTGDLIRLQSLHQRTVESLVSGILTTDAAGKVTSFNPEAERITGVLAADAIGSDVESIIPGVTDRSIAHAGGASQRSRIRSSYRNRRGEALHLGMAAYALRDPDAEDAGAVLIFQDVTEVAAMERSLRQSERLAAIGELSARMAHEIRNPLAAISGSVQVLRAKLEPDCVDERARLMDIVVREADRLNHLITDFLHYARPGSGPREPVAVADAVAEVLELYEAMRPPQVDVEVRIGPEIRAHADPSQLRQVLWNLVLNASQAMPAGGRLLISALVTREDSSQEPGESGRNAEDRAEKARWVEISVADHGVGIPADVLDRIFDPFFTTKPEGTGLGLAVAHRMIENHAGEIRFESHEGEGTTVRMRLPLAEAPA